MNVGSRRQFLIFGLAATAARGSARATLNLSLLPLYSSKCKPVAEELLTAITSALQKTYMVAVNACEPELYDGAGEGEAVLDYIANGEGRIMAVMTGCLRAPAQQPMRTEEMNVLGWADLPSDMRERPRGSVLSTYGLSNQNEDEVMEKLGVVAIHELGHNLGAWDCGDSGCYMNNQLHLGRGFVARGFCKKHRELLWFYLRRQ